MRLKLDKTWATTVTGSSGSSSSSPVLVNIMHSNVGGGEVRLATSLDHAVPPNRPRSNACRGAYIRRIPGFHHPGFLLKQPTSSPRPWTSANLLAHEAAVLRIRQKTNAVAWCFPSRLPDPVKHDIQTSQKLAFARSIASKDTSAIHHFCLWAHMQHGHQYQ